MEFTFYGGVGEIGGNKFLLEHGDTRVFLDFGKSFSRENEYFDFPLLQPFYIQDLRKIQLIPDIEGLYRDSVGEPRMDGVLVPTPMSTTSATWARARPASPDRLHHGPSGSHGPQRQEDHGGAPPFRSHEG